MAYFAESPVNGSFELLSIANPGAGLGFTITLPTNSTYEVQAIRFTLATSAVAGNRIPHIVGRAGGTLSIYGATAGAVSQSASLTRQWMFCNVPLLAALSFTSNYVVPMPLMILSGGNADDILAFVTAIDAGDQITDVRAYVKRWRLI